MELIGLAPPGYTSIFFLVSQIYWNHIWSRSKEKQMDIPDIHSADQILEVSGQRKAVLFYASDPQFADEIHRAIYHKLLPQGPHRNVFLVDAAGAVIWRIADYDHAPGYDYFVGLADIKTAGMFIGTTYGGRIFEISLTDGALRQTGWTK